MAKTSKTPTVQTSADEPTTEMTDAEVAELLGAPAADEDVEPQDHDLDDDQNTDDPEHNDTPLDGGLDDENEENEDLSGEPLDDDDLEEDGADEDQEEDYFAVEDTDLIEVTVDGEVQEVSIADLKKSFSGNAAIDGRLQEATETRKAAHAERTQALENLASQEQVLSQALTALDDSVFVPVITAPTNELKASDPKRYLKHLEAYEIDQKRIKDGRDAVEAKKQELEAQRTERLKEYGAEASVIIAREIPELADPKTAESAYTELSQTALSYGYTQPEIANALDPRMFIMMRDLLAYKKMKGTPLTRDPKDLSTQQGKRVRRLKSGSTTARTTVRKSDKARQAKAAKARKTGSVEDVAATL